jgi:hypothetical protein
MGPARQVLEEGHVAKDAVATVVLLEQLGRKKLPKPKRKRKKQPDPPRCQHDRRKRRCKECGTGHCVHGRHTGRCKECGRGTACTCTGA